MDDLTQGLHEDIRKALAESAPMAWDLASRTCPVDEAGNSFCMSYHRVWQYLGLLAVTSTMRRETHYAPLRPWLNRSVRAPA